MKTRYIIGIGQFIKLNLPYTYILLYSLLRNSLSSRPIRQARTSFSQCWQLSTRLIFIFCSSSIGIISLLRNTLYLFRRALTLFVKRGLLLQTLTFALDLTNGQLSSFSILQEGIQYSDLVDRVSYIDSFLAFYTQIRKAYQSYITLLTSSSQYINRQFYKMSSLSSLFSYSTILLIVYPSFNLRGLSEVLQITITLAIRQSIAVYRMLG